MRVGFAGVSAGPVRLSTRRAGEARSGRGTPLRCRCLWRPAALSVLAGGVSASRCAGGANGCEGVRSAFRLRLALRSLRLVQGVGPQGTGSPGQAALRCLSVGASCFSRLRWSRSGCASIWRRSCAGGDLWRSSLAGCSAGCWRRLSSSPLWSVWPLLRWPLLLRSAAWCWLCRVAIRPYLVALPVLALALLLASLRWPLRSLRFLLCRVAGCSLRSARRCAARWWPSRPRLASG